MKLDKLQKAVLRELAIRGQAVEVVEVTSKQAFTKATRVEMQLPDNKELLIDVIACLRINSKALLRITTAKSLMK